MTEGTSPSTRQQFSGESSTGPLSQLVSQAQQFVLGVMFLGFQIKYKHRVFGPHQTFWLLHCLFFNLIQP